MSSTVTEMVAVLMIDLVHWTEIAGPRGPVTGDGGRNTEFRRGMVLVGSWVRGQ
jgi:hypothetical protein